MMEASILFKNLKLTPPDESLFQIDTAIAEENRARFNYRQSQKGGLLSNVTDEDERLRKHTLQQLYRQLFADGHSI